jgi:hypothetical protein
MGTQHKMLVVATPRFHDSTLLRRPSATIDFAPIQLAVTTSVATFYSIPPPPLRPKSALLRPHILFPTIFDSIDLVDSDVPPLDHNTRSRRRFVLFFLCVNLFLCLI